VRGKPLLADFFHGLQLEGEFLAVSLRADFMVRQGLDPSVQGFEGIPLISQLTMEYLITVIGGQSC
jgi:hypothetical protein